MSSPLEADTVRHGVTARTVSNLLCKTTSGDPLDQGSGRITTGTRMPSGVRSGELSDLRLLLDAGAFGAVIDRAVFALAAAHLAGTRTDGCEPTRWPAPLSCAA